MFFQRFRFFFFYLSNINIFFGIIICTDYPSGAAQCLTSATSTPFKTSGFRSWYSIASPNRKMELEIFVVDFETSIWSPESEEEPGSNKKWNGEPEETVNGLVLYFITEAGDRQQAFIKHEREDQRPG